MKYGKMTSKHQVTVPADVRNALGISAGDHVTFAVEDGRAVLRKANPEDEAWYRFVMSHMTEWASPEDEEAFCDL